jgi:sulfatase maturation enzyme AslB (radical SAM superfamily)
MKREYIFKRLSPIWKAYNRIKSPLQRYPKSGNGFEAVSRETMIQYNSLRYHGAKKLFCYNPYVNIFFNVSGDAIACCRSHENILGTYPPQSIKEIWFGEKYEKMREHMLHNDLNMGCDYCKLQLESNRFHSMPSMIQDEFATSEKGIYPKTIELELSNKCNLECVMCSGRVSSSIRKNRENLPPLEIKYDDDFFQQLKEFIPHAENISFYGGEPFLIDIYYKIWEYVIRVKPGIRLFTVTNGTIYNERIENILKRTNFNLVLSLDSLDKQKFESIRKGADFDIVMSNIEKFSKLIKRNLSISHTPMTINWEDTAEIINFCNRIDARINLSYVDKPAKYALWSMMPNELDEIYDYYSKVKFDDSRNKYTASYNIKVFNEWKEQVRYFRDKNAKILSEFGDLDVKCDELKNELLNTLKHFFKEVPNDWMSFDDAYHIIKTEVFNMKRSPIQIEGMQTIIRDFSDVDVIKQPIAKEFLTNVDKFSNYVKNIISENEFWARYY